MNYYEEIGCCLTCDDETKEYNELDDGTCLCYECKCRKCSEYDRYSQTCMIADEYRDKYEDVWIEIGGIKVETEKARLVLFSEGRESKEVWIPKSLSRIDKKWKSVVLPKWLAVEKGLYELDEHDYWRGD